MPGTVLGQEYQNQKYNKLTSALAVAARRGGKAPWGPEFKGRLHQLTCCVSPFASLNHFLACTMGGGRFLFPGVEVGSRETGYLDGALGKEVSKVSKEVRSRSSPVCSQALGRPNHSCWLSHPP